MSPLPPGISPSATSLEKGMTTIPLPPGISPSATSLPACGGALQTGIKKAQSSKLVALFCYRFAEEEGFEPSVLTTC